MNVPLSEEDLARVSGVIAARTGLHFPQPRWRDLERNLSRAAAELGHRNVRACVEWLLSGPPPQSDFDVLASHLTIGETYFFRDRKLFHALEHVVFPELIASRRRGQPRLRIWSAGCATGEEPYSIALLLLRLIPDIREWSISLLGTDINRRSLVQAATGQYGDWSFRETPPHVKEANFRRARDSRYTIRRPAQALVRFEYLNLVEDVYPSVVNNTNAQDLIFCRNVLMYFEPGRAQRAAQRLEAALVDGGWLIVSPAEASSELFGQLTAEYIDGAILYRKKAGSHRATDEGTRIAPFSPAAWPPPFAADAPEFAATSSGTCASAPAEPHPGIASASSTAEGMPEFDEESAARPAYSLDRAAKLCLLGRYDDALLELDKAGQRSLGEFKLHARICANLGRLDEARAWCEKAIQHDRLDAGSYYLLGVVEQERGNLHAAATALRQSLYLEPALAVSHFALSDLARRLGNSADAMKHRRHALAVLAKLPAEAIVPESDGMTAGRLRISIEGTLSTERT